MRENIFGLLCTSNAPSRNRRGTRAPPSRGKTRGGTGRGARGKTRVARPRRLAYASTPRMSLPGTPRSPLVGARRTSPRARRRRRRGRRLGVERRGRHRHGNARGARNSARIGVRNRTSSCRYPWRETRETRRLGTLRPPPRRGSRRKSSEASRRPGTRRSRRTATRVFVGWNRASCGGYTRWVCCRTTRSPVRSRRCARNCPRELCCAIWWRRLRVFPLVGCFDRRRASPPRARTFDARASASRDTGECAADISSTTTRSPRGRRAPCLRSSRTCASFTTDTRREPPPNTGTKTSRIVPRWAWDARRPDATRIHRPGPRVACSTPCARWSEATTRIATRIPTTTYISTTRTRSGRIPNPRAELARSLRRSVQRSRSVPRRIAAGNSRRRAPHRVAPVRSHRDASPSGAPVRLARASVRSRVLGSSRPSLVASSPVKAARDAAAALEGWRASVVATVDRATDGSYHPTVSTRPTRVGEVVRAGAWEASSFLEPAPAPRRLRRARGAFGGGGGGGGGAPRVPSRTRNAAETTRGRRRRRGDASSKEETRANRRFGSGSTPPPPRAPEAERARKRDAEAHARVKETEPQIVAVRERIVAVRERIVAVRERRREDEPSATEKGTAVRARESWRRRVSTARVACAPTPPRTRLLGRRTRHRTRPDRRDR